MEQGTAPFSFFQKQRSEKHRKEGKTGVMFDIQEELKKLPGKPGVYIMHDAKDTIIYVGAKIVIFPFILSRLPVFEFHKICERRTSTLLRQQAFYILRHFPPASDKNLFMHDIAYICPRL